MDTIVLIKKENKKTILLIKAEAIIEIISLLNIIFRIILLPTKLIPLKILNYFYDFIA